MRFRYSTTDPTQHESDSLPWLPVVLRVGARAVEAVGLVDNRSRLEFDIRPKSPT